MNKFDKATCIKLRQELNTVLAKYGAEAGVTVELGNMRYTQDEARFTSVTIRIKGAQKREEVALGNQFSIHGLNATNAKGDMLVEYNRRRYAYPFIYVRKSDGKRYKCSLDQCKRLGFATASVK